MRVLTMLRESITPKDRAHWLQLRALNLNSTQIPALFGLSPYLTYFELWHSIHKKIPDDFKDNERTIWGNRLQDAIAKGIGEDEKLDVSPAPEYMWLPEHRLGSSFDWWIGTDGILEIKNVDALIFREGWLIDDDKNIEAPLHIELQIQHQLLVSGRKFVRVGAFVGGNRVAILERLPNLDTHNAILERSAMFWKSIEAGDAPMPDFEKDAAFISKRLFNNAVPGKIIDATDNQMIEALALKHISLGEQERDTKLQKEAIKAELLMVIGDCSKVLGNGYSISAGVIASTFIEAHEKKAYRRVAVTRKKVK